MQNGTSQAIAKNQASLYRCSVACAAVILTLWAPILFMQPGSGIRPMMQLPISVLLLLVTAPIQYGAIRQLART